MPKYSRLGASSRLRTFQYLPLWKNNGYQVTISPFLNEEYLNDVYAQKRPDILNVLKSYLRRAKIIFTISQYDIIWIEKEVFPYLPPFAERLIKIFGKGYIVDYDDAVFHNYDQHKQWLIRTWMGNKIDSVMRNANLVWVGNAYLHARTITAGAKQARMLPTVVDLNKYNVKTDHSPSDLPVVGWIGSPTTLKYVRHLFPTLVKLYEKASFKLIIIGKVSRIDYKGKWEVLNWSEENEAKYIQQVDIGIMPLPDSDWEQGKCAYKLIQYMACGLPVVASPVGMNKDVVRHGENGFLAASESEWIAHLTTLILDPALRVRMGLQGRKLVEEEYSLEKNCEKMQAWMKEQE